MVSGSWCIRSLSLAVVLGLGWLIAAPSPVRAASLLEKNFWLSGPNYDNVLPPCEAGLGEVSDGFAVKEHRFWNSALRIVGFNHVREIGRNTWVNGTIPRRYCRAVAYVTPGPHIPPRRHTVYYWIGEDTGMIGATWGVTWCVTGLDRNWSYDPYCRRARP